VWQLDLLIHCVQDKKKLEPTRSMMKWLTVGEFDED